MAAGANEKSGENVQPDDYLAKLGINIKIARKRAGFTLAQLGQKSGFVASYIHLLENRGTNLTLIGLRNIAAALNLSPQDLLPLPEGHLSEPAYATVKADVAKVVALIEKRTELDDAALAILRDLLGPR